VLSTLLVQVPWLAFSALIAVIVIGPFAGVWLTRHPRATVTLLVVAIVGVVALTLYPGGTPGPSVACTVGLPYLAPTAVESIANILMFVPVAFFAALRYQRPVLAVLGATAFSALIEVVQALVLGIGRACDTSDWITNTIGAVIGGGLATVALARRRHRGRLSSAQ
jgi:hypothetical protein